MKLPHRRQFLHLAAGAVALPVVSRIAWAQAYPTRPVRLIEGFGAGDSCLSDSPVARSSAPPNQTMFSGFDDALAARLQRISPAISATCASAMRTTFRQNRAGARHELYELPRIYSAIVKGS